MCKVSIQVILRPEGGVCLALCLQEDTSGGSNESWRGWASTPTVPGESPPSTTTTGERAETHTPPHTSCQSSFITSRVCVCVIPQALCQLPRANNRACCRHRPGAGEGGGVQIMEEDPSRRLQVFLSLIKDCSGFSKHINDMLKDTTKGLHNYP